MTKHKWHKEIKAWADGAEIEFKLENAWWDAGIPEWNEDGEYRIKPQPFAKCIVKDCMNHTNEGKFVGELCAPCFNYIANGKGVHSQAYRNAQPKEPQYLYVYTAGNSVLQGFGKLRPDLDWDYIGKIKLEVDDGADVG